MIEFAKLSGFAALLALPVIVALFSLRPKRRTVIVSTNALWREAFSERRQGMGLQRLLRSLSLILSLLAALALGLALAEPQWRQHTARSGDLVVVIDTSASMQARAGDKSRFERAVAAARALIDGLPEEHRLLLLESGAKARILTGFERDKLRLRRRLSRLRVSDEAGRPAEAVTLALSLLANRAGGRIVFVSDAAFDGELDTGGADFELLDITRDEPGLAQLGSNVGITQFDLRRELAREDGFEVFVRVRNYGEQPVSAGLDIALEGRSLASRKLNLRALAEQDLTLRFEGRASGRLSAELLVADDFAVDNIARAVLQPRPRRGILMVGAPNPYLEGFFAAFPRLDVKRRETIDAQALIREAARHDLVVLNGTELRALPAGNFLIFGQVPGGLPFASEGVVRNVRVTGVGQRELLQGLDFRAVRIDRALRLRLSELGQTERLLWSGEDAFVLSHLSPSRRVVYFAFDLSASNFGEQAIFPLFMGAMVEWLTPTVGLETATNYAAGDVVSIPVAAKAQEAMVRLPSAEASMVAVGDGRLTFAQTRKAGFYRYDVSGITRHFAVNANDSAESDLRPRFEAPAQPVSAAGVGDALVVEPLWRWALVGALALLVLEWVTWSWGRLR